MDDLSSPLINLACQGKTAHLLTRILIGLLPIVSTSLMAESKQLIPIATGEYPPFVSATLPNQGMLVEIITAAFAGSQFSPVFSFTSWPRVEAMVRSGQAFAGMPYHWTKERDEAFLFSPPLHQGKIVFFHLQSQFPNGIKALHLGDLQSIRVATPHGYWFEPIFKRAGIQLSYAIDEEQALRQVLLKRADTVPLEQLFGTYLIKQRLTKQTALFKQSPGLTEDRRNHDYFMIVSRTFPKTEAILTVFSQGLQRLHDSGEYHRIQQRCQSMYEIDPKP
ncbi:transporter substrate-binding domain-containing protein [Chitinivorax sp. B]|uniref:substrate-binding periplasmic protein n=1 Tax=Chitinivorax sp. B TaxID=2502235 RepID=UPI0010F9CA2B|nr:transporter substrate-binding domain-containing protein [Chitinivorax sp. B]